MPDGRMAVVSCTVTEVALPLVTFEGSTAIGKEIMRSTSTLRFRQRTELERDLSRSGSTSSTYAMPLIVRQGNGLPDPSQGRRRRQSVLTQRGRQTPEIRCMVGGPKWT